MKVFNKLDINPTNMNLYMEAVTHSSFTNENPYSFNDSTE